MVIALAGTPGLSAEKKSWEDETVLVSKQGDQAVVRKMNDDKVLFKSKDGEAAMVWAMANGRTTVVLAGKYFLSKSVVPPRDGVTLILTKESDLEMSPDSKQTEAMGFRGGGKIAQQILPSGGNPETGIRDRNPSPVPEGPAKPPHDEMPANPENTLPRCLTGTAIPPTMTSAWADTGPLGVLEFLFGQSVKGEA
jgi:hypothetical protein